MTPERFERLKDALERRQPDLTVLCEDVHKKHNISAILRSCDAVGIGELQVISPDETWRHYRGIAGGSHKWVDTRCHPDIRTAITTLQDTGHQVVAAHFSADAIDYREHDFTRPTALLLGAEREGLSPVAAKLADRHIIIPMRGLVRSLNVSVAAAVILYEAARQRESAGLYDSPQLDEQTRRQRLFEWSYPAVAEHCRRHGLPYPELDAEGFMVPEPAEGRPRLPRQPEDKARRT